MSDSASTNVSLSDPSQWVRLYGDCLYRFAILRVRDANIAEELVQETFLAALKSRGSFAGQCSERTWLIGILKHKAMDHHRRQWRDHQEPLGDDSQVEAMFGRLGHWTSPPRKWDKEMRADNPMEEAEFREHFQKCLKKLPPQLAAAFMAKVVDEEQTDSVCKALAISATNLWVILHRARLRLRKCLEVNWLARRPEDQEP